MPITVNEGGTLYQLKTVTANEGGTLYELNTVHSNEGGTLYEIFGNKTLLDPIIDSYTGNTTYLSSGDRYLAIKTIEVPEDCSVTLEIVSRNQQYTTGVVTVLMLEHETYGAQCEISEVTAKTASCKAGTCTLKVICYSVQAGPTGAPSYGDATINYKITFS